MVHAANSAAVLREPRAHFDMARCGIAVYGLDPFNEDPFAARPGAGARAQLLRRRGQALPVGESTGYGRRYVAERDTHIGVLPIGYGDGFRRALSSNADVLIAGARLPLVGTVSMDNVAVDLGPDPAATRAVRRRGGPDRRKRPRADHRRGAGPAHGHDQLRDRPVRARSRADRVRSAYEDGAAGAAGAGGRAWPRAEGGDAERGAGRAVGRRRCARHPRRLADARPGWWAAPRATALLGRDTFDLDVVVDALPRARARAIARAAGGAACFELSEDFSGWRVVARAGSWQVDVQPLRGGSLDADLRAARLHRRRDRRTGRRRASRSILSEGWPISRRGACAWHRRVRSPTIPCACCASCGWRSISASRPTPSTASAARAAAPGLRARVR